MWDPFPGEELARPLGALAEPRRLAIVALLTRRPHFGEELADVLGLHPATVSHHVRRLRDVGLVVEERQPPYTLLRLDPDALDGALAPLRDREDLQRRLNLPSEEDLSAHLLARHLDDEGRLRALPRSRRERRVVLRHIAQHLQTGRIYPEREVRRILLQWSDDVQELEAALVDLGWLRRGHGVMHRVDEVDE